MTTRSARRGPFGRPIVGAAAALFLTTVIAVVLDGTPFQTFAPVAAQAPSDTYKDVYDGWKWWHVYCYRCHGVNAVGATTAPDLTDPNRKLTAAEFLRIVRDGTPDQGMQAWDQLLDRKQISQIHLYVRARTDKVLPPGRPDEVGPNGGPWVPPAGWPPR
jgi:mono/diheme cytochrome c family protein